MPKSEDDKVMKGGPGQDDLDDNQDNLDNNQDDDDNQDENDDNKKKPVYVTQEQLQEFQARQNQVLSMLESLTKKQPDQQQDDTVKGKGKKIAGMSQEDFEQLFWENPSAALEQFKTSIVAEMRAETGKSQGQQAFWNDFYSDNDDLKGESDLVQLVLNQNLKDLADLPVAEAKVKLADLTRKRILRYSGEKKNEGEGRKRVVVEGTSHRNPPKKSDDEMPPPKTLGELIRARKAARRNSGKAVAT